MKWQSWNIAVIIVASLSACVSPGRLKTKGKVIEVSTLGPLPVTSDTTDWPSERWWTQYGDRQ